MNRYIIPLSFLSLISTASAKSIEQLKYADGLPISYFNNQTSVQIAEQLVKRLSKERDDRGGKVNYRHSSDILIAFYEKSAKSILESGCFYNAHELGASTYTYSKLDLREKFENQYINLDLSKNENLSHKNKLKSLRPKYAFLQHNLENLPKGKLTQTFGGVLGKVKDSVKNRSTFSLGDQEREDGHLNVHTFSHTGIISDKKNKADIYWEAHIWGELCLNDIDYYLVNCPGFQQISQPSLKLFLKQGIPVYTCKMEDGLFKKNQLIKTSNLSQFKLTTDSTNPKIENIKITKSEKTSKYDVEFIAEDESLSFCEVSLHFENKVFSGDLDLNPSLKKGICKWSFGPINENFKYVELVVKDSFGNKQIQTINKTPNIMLP